MSATCLIAGFDGLGDCLRVHGLSIRFGTILLDVEVLRGKDELMDCLHLERSIRNLHGPILLGPASHDKERGKNCQC